jgi:hypothetical protein
MEAVEAREAVVEEVMPRGKARPHEPAAEAMESTAAEAAVETITMETTTVETTTVEAAHAGFSGRGRSHCSQEDDTCQCYHSPTRHSLLHLLRHELFAALRWFRVNSQAPHQPTR